ncbi:SAM-dependent methyltransferase [Nocardiopsis sp. NPDC006139]|uniref:SAM-dependent methyltransferase n=1 Tax=Nocardiopsis sp. NPDC006139 TaxID=3154578 RepID=UPI0033A2072D
MSVDTDTPPVLGQFNGLLDDQPRVPICRVPRTAMVQADLRDPDGILTAADTLALLDFDRPVGLLLAEVLDFLPDTDHPHDVMRTFLNSLAPGSFIAISHITDEADPDRASLLEEFYSHTLAPRQTRGRHQIAHFFDGTEPVHPGLSYVCDWTPHILWRPHIVDPYWPPAHVWMLGGVGHL